MLNTRVIHLKHYFILDISNLIKSLCFVIIQYETTDWCLKLFVIQLLFLTKYFILIHIDLQKQFFQIHWTGLYNTHDLTLRVTDTNISSLPSGLLKYLADIRFITIDLRKNKLKTLKPDVFLVKSENKFNRNWESQQMLGKHWFLNSH